MTTGTVIAVTGDVGAGKSTVSRLFESLGGFLIDADRVVAELWLRPEVIAAAVERWGTDILDGGRVVHARVAQRVFAGNRREYDWLTALLHPRVKEEIKRRLDLLRVDGKWAVVEIPLLFEAGVASWVTVKVFVTASREVRLARCRARGWDEAEMARRESFFMPSPERMALSDYVVRNDGDLNELGEAVKRIYNTLEETGGSNS